MQALLMSNLVFGGGSPFATLSLWVAPLPVVAVAAADFLLGKQHILKQSLPLENLT
jgi:predicted branched-subunit amino acid permease